MAVICGHAGLVNFGAFPVASVHVPRRKTVDVRLLDGARGSNLTRPAMPRFMAPSRSSGLGAGVSM